jgi:hypothetical protein
MLPGASNLITSIDELPHLPPGFQYPPKGARIFESLLDSRSPLIQFRDAITRLYQAFSAIQTVAKREALVLAIEAAVPLLISTFVAYEAFDFQAYESSSTGTTYSSSSTTSSSSSTSSSAKETPTEWLLSTKHGTTLAEYKSLIQSLPDAGTGSQIVYPNLKFQGYVSHGSFLLGLFANFLLCWKVTMMNVTMAKITSQNPIVDFVGQNTRMTEQPDPEEYPSSNDINSNESVDITANLRRNQNHGRDLPAPDTLVVQQPSFEHQKVISQSPADVISGGPLKNYLYDPSERDSVTLYIFDRGFYLDHVVGSFFFHYDS